jgi:hypothetical protein
MKDIHIFAECVNYSIQEATKCRSWVLDRKLVRVLLVLFEEHEKTPLSYSKDLLNIFSFDFILYIAYQKFFHLIRAKSFVQLRHSLNLPMSFRLYPLRNWGCACFKFKSDKTCALLKFK